MSMSCGHLRRIMAQVDVIAHDSGISDASVFNSQVSEDGDIVVELKHGSYTWRLTFSQGGGLIAIYYNVRGETLGWVSGNLTPSGALPKYRDADG